MAQRTPEERQAVFEKFQRMIEAMTDIAKLGRTFIVLGMIAGIDDEDCDKLEVIMTLFDFDDEKLDEAIKGMTKQ